MKKPLVWLAVGVMLGLCVPAFAADDYLAYIKAHQLRRLILAQSWNINGFENVSLVYVGDRINDLTYAVSKCKK